MDIIRRRQRNWIGHILRGYSLQGVIMEGRVEGKRKSLTKAHALDNGGPIPVFLFCFPPAWFKVTGCGYEFL